MLSSDPYITGAEYSLSAYSQAGFEVEIVRSVMEAMEKAKKNRYALFIVERTGKKANSDDDIFQVIGMISNLNPNCKVMSQGWQSKGLHYFISRDYKSSESQAWFNFLKEIYRELSLSETNLH